MQQAVGLLSLTCGLAALLFALFLVLATVSNAIGNARRRRWQEQRDRLPDGWPRPVAEDAEPISLDSLRGQLAMKTDERAVFTREGGFVLKPKRKKKHGRKSKHR